MEKQKGSIVPSAWINSQQAKEVAEFYVSGHSVKETAEKFGVSTAQVNNLAKKRGLTNGKYYRDARQEYRKKETVERLAKSLEQKGFSYLGGYENKGSKISVICCACGYTFIRTYGFLRMGNVACRRCEHKKTIQRRNELKEQQERERKLKELQRELEKRFIPKADQYETQHEEFLNRSGVCEICVKPYSVRDYVLSCGLKYARDNGVCSVECRKKKNRIISRANSKNKTDSHRHRARKFGCEYDPSITLKRLIERDGMKCKICGGVCKLDDHSWSKFSGPLYPSIDHIIPMSKGGGHVWGNVQIAHIICNSYKGDSLEGVKG